MKFAHSTSFVVAAILLVSAAAVDVTAGSEDQPLQQPLQEPGFVLAEAYHQVRYAAAAYCTLARPGLLTAWTCDSCKAARRLDDIASINKAKARGFVGYDRNSSLIVAVFSGTPITNIPTWLAKIDAAQVNAFDLCSGCKAHKGFYAGYTSIRDFMLSATSKLMKLYPKASVVATGHSLGGAHATYFMAEASKKGWKLAPRYYTYGAPRPGCPKLATHLSSLPSKLYRLVNQHDPVPHVPPISMTGDTKVPVFKHPATEIFFTDSKVPVPHTCSIDKTGEYESCPKQRSKKVDKDLISAHMLYTGTDFNKGLCATDTPRDALTSFANDLKTTVKNKVKDKIKKDDY